VMVLGVGMVGCEWQGGSGDNALSNATGAANFTATYTSSTGGYIVSLSTAAQTTNTAGETDSIAVQDPNQFLFNFSGTTQNKPVLAGTVTVSWSAGTARDSGSDGKLFGPGSTSGTIDYQTGQIHLTIDLGYLPQLGSKIWVTYSYDKVNSTGGTAGITSLTVQQKGQAITIIDNNGKSYSGSLGPTQTGSGTPVASANSGDEVTSSFSASGQSADGANVNLVGTFSATVSGSPPSSIVLSNRRMTGSWIENTGVTAGINGTAN